MTDRDTMLENMQRGGDLPVPADSLWQPGSAQPRYPAIGLSGFASTGKTEAANYIARTYGYERLHIAEPLRRMEASLLRDLKYDDATIERFLTGDLKEAIIPELGVTSRWFQIALGTEFMREQVNPDGWVILWSIAAEGRRAMNDSVRFANEEHSIKLDLDGFTIMIRRPGTGPAAFKWKRVGPLLYRWFGCMWGVHDSERTDRLSPSEIIDNDGTLDDLYRAIDRVMLARLSHHV